MGFRSKIQILQAAEKLISKKEIFVVMKRNS